MSIFGELKEVKKGVPESSDMLVNEISALASPLLQQNSLAQAIRIESPFKVEVLDNNAPKSVEFRNRKSTYFVDMYARASYDFYHCSIFSTVVLRIVQEALRNGIDWKPKFQCMCPNCGHRFQRSTRKCTNCTFEGDMLLPDETQKDLLVNWEGTSLIEKANRNGWDLLQVVRSFLIMALVYNQPVIHCKSKYAVDEHGNVLEEFPQEFVPLSPTRAKMIYDETGEPGDGTAFYVKDRHDSVNLNDPVVAEEIMRTGYYNNKRYYVARWSVSETDGGNEGDGMYFADQEIYHDTYMLPSVTYGTPLCLLVQADIRAWEALELRTEKYYTTGHPPGVFVVNNITPESTAKVQQAIRIQMRDDPYSVPLIGIPPASDKTTSTKWHPFSVDPAESMVIIKQELLQRISSVFGMTGLFLGDSESMRGNSNESHQVALLDRNLVQIRKFVNKFLNRGVVAKYKGITDWELDVVEPPDNQSIDEAEKFNKQLLNAKLAKDLGFEIISQNEGKIEISATPQSYDPLQSLFSDGGGAEAQGISTPDNTNNPFDQSKSNSEMFKDSMSKDGTAGGDIVKKATTKGMSIEQRIANAILNGEVKVSDLYIHR